MSATRLLVLGVVRMYGRAHGYQVRRELLTWYTDRWANVQPGSIYHALKKMTAERLLELVDTEPGAAGPDRTAYRITAEGEAEFQILLARALSEPKDPAVDVSAGITLMTTLPRHRAISLLKHQLVHLEAMQQSSMLLIDEEVNRGEPGHVGELFQLWSAVTEVKATWLRKLIGRLDAGEYVMADDEQRAFGEPPDQAGK